MNQHDHLVCKHCDVYYVGAMEKYNGKIIATGVAKIRTLHTSPIKCVTVAERINGVVQIITVSAVAHTRGAFDVIFTPMV